MVRKATILLVASLCWVGLFAAPGWAQSRTTTSGKPTTTTTTTTKKPTTTTTTKKPTTTTTSTAKKPVRKPATTKTTAEPAAKTPAAKKKSDILPYGLGLKIGIMPYNSMKSTVKGGGSKDYNMRMAYGLGVDGQYRLGSRFFVMGEAMYWFTEIKELNGTSYEATSRDGLLDLAVGLKVVLYGKETANDQVYARGTVGFADYIMDDDNLNKTDRAGIYYGFGAGIQHRMGRTIRLFAETGLYWASFTAISDTENEGTFFSWQGSAGFLVHWK